MASYRGVHAVLLALEAGLNRRLPAAWRQAPMNARARLLGSSELGQALSGNFIGVYLHRLSVDGAGRNRFLPPAGGGEGQHGELPVNLHVLVIANGASAGIEADLMAWAMLELAGLSQLDSALLADLDPDWLGRERVAVTPEEMSSEDLMRVWDQLEASYTLTVPYVLRSVRLRLAAVETAGPPVRTRVFPVADPGPEGAP